MAQSSLKLWFGILMALPTLLSAQELDLAGEWETTWGEVSFSRIEGGYDGSYDTDDGRIRLLYTVDGTYEGEWSESESDQRCETPSPITGSYYWGRIIGPLLNRPEGLTFQWSHCDQGAFNNTWQFNRENTPSIPENTRAGFEGNWRVTWENSSQSEGLISIYKPFDWDCVHPEDSWCQKRVMEGSSMRLNGGQLNPGKHSSAYVDLLSEGLMNIKWGYDHFGLWRGKSSIKSSIKYVDDNYLYGEWSGNDGGGKAIWRRVKARIDATGALVQGANGLHYIDRKPLGQPVTITTNYVGQNYRSRGNRKSVSLDLYGQNMWGIHDYYLPRESGIEISGHRYICANGEIEGKGSDTNSVCIERGGVIGLQLAFVIWSEAHPGLHSVKFDDQKIPFNLEIKGHDAQFVAEAPQTTITDLVLLDDQVGQRQQEGARVKNYSYPYDRRGYMTDGLNTRLLAVIGKNLDFDGQNFLSSEDAGVSYQRLTLPANIQSAVNRAAAHLSNKPIAADEEVITVRADLKRGVRGGVKHLLVNGAPKSWSLVFNDQLGHLQFLRAGSTPNDLRERIFYNGETIYIGVKARNDNYPIDNFDVVLEAKKYSALTPDSNEIRQLAPPITLRRTDDIRRGENFAKSTAILLNRTEEDTGGAPASLVNGKLEITLQPGERLVARPADRFSLITIPPVISADILDRPRRLGLWTTALHKVALCPGVGGDPNATEFPSKPSKIFSNWIMTDGATREIKVTKGDHAALILIRDELLPLVKAENEKLGQYIGAGSHGLRLASQFYGLAVQTPGSAQNAFWSARKETLVEYTSGPMGGQSRTEHQVTLAQLFDANAFRNILARIGQRLTLIDTRERINEIVAKHLKLQYQDTNAAILNGRDAGNCDIKELLVIAGQKAEPVVAKLLPELVKRENYRWIPDTEARGFVQGVHILGEAARSQEAYAKIDNAYKSLAVALVAVPFAAGGSALAASGGANAVTAGTALARLAIAADFFDMAYYGRKGVKKYLDGEEDYYTQLGLGPVLGPEIVKEASARRDSLLAATIGIIAPGISGLAGLRSLDDITKVNKGRALVRSPDGLSSLDEISDTQRTDVAAYYKDLKEIEASTTARLSAAEQADVNNLDELILTSNREIIMPRGKVGGLAELKKGEPSGMPSGRQGGMPGKSIDGISANQIVTDLRPYGMKPNVARAIQEAVDESGLRVRIRPANDASLTQMRDGHPPKHVKLKSKTISDLDVALGAPPGSQGMVGYFEPKMPGLKLPEAPNKPTATQLDIYNEKVAKARQTHAKLEERFEQRQKEFVDNATDMDKLQKQGLVSVENGVVVDRGLSNTRLQPDGQLKFDRAGPSGGTGKGFTGDHDMWDITLPDGRNIVRALDAKGFDPEAYRRYLALRQSLDTGLAATQHGAHKEWIPLVARDRAIDAKIRGSHGPGQEPLLEFNPNQRPRSSYETGDIPTTPSSPDGAITVKIDPNSTRADEAATQILPGGFASPTQIDSMIDEVKKGLPTGQVDLFERPPGARLAERGINDAEINRLIEKSRNGHTLTSEEKLDKIDYLRVQRQQMNNQ